MTGDIQLSCLSNEAAVRVLLKRLMPMLDDWGLDVDALATAQIVLAETLNNIAEHAFPNCDDAVVAIHVRACPHGLEVATRDCGRPMPGLTLPEGCCPDPTVPVDELAEGGFGWFLIRAQTEGLAYARKNGVNHLRYTVPVSTDFTPAYGANGRNVDSCTHFE